MRTSRLKGWLLVLATALSLLACGANLPAGSQTPPRGHIKPSSVAADEFENNVRNQLFDSSKSDIRLSVTDEQITSYVALRYRNLSLENPQVWFTGGKTYLRGTYTGLCLFHPDVLVVAAPSVKNTKILVNVQQVYVGSFALPEDWLPTISKSVSDTIEDARLNLDFVQVKILDGELLITGSKHAG